jgi:hypothetical protein
MTSVGKSKTKKNAAPRPKARTTVLLKNFTGRVSRNPDHTVSIIGRGRRGK